MSWNLPDKSRYGVHSIDHFSLEVPELDQAQKFFTTFGLDVTHSCGGLALRTKNNPHVWGHIFRGPRKRLAYLSFNCYAHEYEALCAQLDAQGVESVTNAPYVNAQGHWFRDPDGNLLQLKHGPKTTPSHLASGDVIRQLAGQRGALPRAETSAVHPSRLSHVLLFTSDMDRSINFFRDALGLRLSDRSHNAVAFMHARHGSDHHLVAFAGSNMRGWHHSSWTVENVDEVGRGAEQMREGGYREGWGVGRHVLGSNYFHYVRDPWGSFAEYSANIDFVPENSTWQARNFNPEDSLSLWGPTSPDYFTHNTEVG